MRRFVREVSAFAALTLAIPCAAELMLRLLNARVERAVFEPAVDGDGTPVVRLAWNPQFRTAEPPRPQRQFRRDKARNTFRIFVIGESPAAGLPYGPELAFSSWLAKRLAAQAPEVDWQVINAALAGAQSWSALTIVRDSARYAPDLLVIYLGHNEVGTRFSPAERQWLDPSHLRARLLDTRDYQLLSRVLPTRAASRMIDLRNVHRPGLVNASEGGRRVYATAADRALSAALYRARLQTMLRVMRSAGAHTMVLTLSQNFSDWPPAMSSHRPGLRPAEKAAWRAAVREGDALASQDCPGALAAWSRALAIDDGFAELQFKVARCERALGRFEAARARFRRASDLDRLPQGAPTSFNEILRDVAQRENAILVDIDAVFTDASGPILVGDDLFIESVHLSLRGHQLIAKAVADAIREAGLPNPQVRWNPSAYVDPDPEVLVAADPELRAMELLTRALSCQAAARVACAREALASAARVTTDAATRARIEQGLQNLPAAPGARVGR